MRSCVIKIRISQIVRRITKLCLLEMIIVECVLSQIMKSWKFHGRGCKKCIQFLKDLIIDTFTDQNAHLNFVIYGDFVLLCSDVNVISREMLLP